eukprot:1161509-Pelagomonas_calceolata.AAC.6
MQCFKPCIGCAQCGSSDALGVLQALHRMCPEPCKRCALGCDEKRNWMGRLGALFFGLAATNQRCFVWCIVMSSLSSACDERASAPRPSARFHTQCLKGVQACWVNHPALNEAACSLCVFPSLVAQVSHNPKSGIP